eukprot:GHUV01022061.1.p1 GENE.GHUV01022061.1~~GHUV01022061.1.p1  ORF type:complete len:109 (+),score=6.40 GHUV01022061.1:414-740(+)
MKRCNRAVGEAIRVSADFDPMTLLIPNITSRTADTCRLPCTLTDSVKSRTLSSNHTGLLISRSELFTSYLLWTDQPLNPDTSKFTANNMLYYYLRQQITCYTTTCDNK